MNVIEEAKKVFDIEAQAILSLKENLDTSFLKAVDLILKTPGKVIITGMGKSGHIARKIASTLSSTGTPAFFLHPAESSHGDLGMLSQGDLLIALSYSGESAELSNILNFSVRKNIPIICLTGNSKSSLASFSTVMLSVEIKKEACPLGLAPTASAVATLAMGDALAVACLTQRGFGPENFAELHPAGSLGFRLLTQVKDLMHSGDSMAIVNPSTDMKEVISKMTSKNVKGIAGVVDDKGSLVGLITDGDLRRKLYSSNDPLRETAERVMSLNPRSIDASELASKALLVMEEFSIQALFVMDKTSQRPRTPVGILHIQDLLKSKVR